MHYQNIWVFIVIVLGMFVYTTINEPIETPTGKAFFANDAGGSSGVQTTSSDNVRNIIVNGIVIGKVDSGSVEYFHGDRIGNNRIVTDQVGNKISEFKSLPFGQTIFRSTNRYEFTGKEKDESNLYHFIARQYDPDLGKFTSTDPVIDNHAFSYVNHNPFKFIDPDGMQSVAVGTDPAVSEAVKKLMEFSKQAPPSTPPPPTASPWYSRLIIGGTRVAGLVGIFILGFPATAHAPGIENNLDDPYGDRSKHYHYAGETLAHSELVEENENRAQITRKISVLDEEIIEPPRPSDNLRKLLRLGQEGGEDFTISRDVLAEIDAELEPYGDQLVLESHIGELGGDGHWYWPHYRLKGRGQFKGHDPHLFITPGQNVLRPTGRPVSEQRLEQKYPGRVRKVESR